MRMQHFMGFSKLKSNNPLKEILAKKEYTSRIQFLHNLEKLLDSLTEEKG